MGVVEPFSNHFPPRFGSNEAGFLERILIRSFLDVKKYQCYLFRFDHPDAPRISAPLTSVPLFRFTPEPHIDVERLGLISSLPQNLNLQNSDYNSDMASSILVTKRFIPPTRVELVQRLGLEKLEKLKQKLHQQRDY